MMLYKKGIIVLRIFLSVILVSFSVTAFFSVCSAEDSVLSTVYTAPTHLSTVDHRTSDFVQQVVYNLLLKKTSDVVEMAVKSGNLKLLPQSAYQVIQYTAKNVFEYPQLRDRIKAIYDEGIKVFQEQQEARASSAQITEAVKDSVGKGLDQIILDKGFHAIIEQMIQRAMAQDKQVLMQYGMQQQAQQAIIDQQKALQEETKRSMTRALQESGVYIR